MADYHWPEAGKRSLIGKRISRLDGPDKASGRAKYTYDVHPPGMLYGKVLRCPFAHAKVVSVDTSAAESMPGVKAVHIVQDAGSEIHWAGDDVVVVAAVDEQTASDALRAIKVEYQPLPFFVDDFTEPKNVPEGTGPATSPYKKESEQVKGEPDDAFRQAEVTSEGIYGCPVITHCCLESHGSISEWTDDDHLFARVSTQNVSGLAGQFAQALKIPAGNVHVHQDHVGGGFGSKFGIDRWGIYTAQVSKKAGGKPVRYMLERDAELLVAGARPSARARVKVGAKRDGTLLAWQSESWGTGGPGGGGAPPLPYVINIPNQRKQHTAIATNIGPARAWRAPNHPQGCLITMSALEDTAAKIGMDPVDLLLKNIQLTGRLADTYSAELKKGAELMEWKKKWHPRGDKSPGPIKRGLGVSLHTWGGGGHDSRCQATIHPDGSVEVSLGSQDLGTGTRTVIAIVAAETLGLPLQAVKVNLGDTSYPPSGGSGGSTTVGGVSSSTRRGVTNALNELLEKVAPALGAKADDLEAVNGRIQVKGDPSKSLTWKQACAKLGATPITAQGQTSRDLISSGVGGIQMAEVAVDTETGIVRMEKMVAVQDCGLIIDLKTAESQVPGAAISNAVANAIGVRVPELPLTTDRVLAALEKGGAA